MKLTDAPIERVSHGGMPQDRPLCWGLWGYPESIQVNQYEGHGRFSTPYLVEPDQIARTNVNLIKSGAHLILRRASLASPTVSEVELIGNLRRWSASVVLVKQLGLAR